MNWDEYKQQLFAIRQLVSREVKRKYARSYLGIVWSVLNPLMTMAVMSMIFSTMFRRSIENFPIYYLTGSIFWELFAASTNSAMSALVDNKTLLLRVKMPKQTFVMSRVYTALTNFGYTSIAYVLMLIIFRITPSWTMLLFPLPVICILLFAMGIGYILSILYVFFGDIRYLYSVLLTLWMYLSAIFYPLDQLPPEMITLVSFNPVYTYINFARQIMIYQTIPDIGEWMKMILWGVGTFVVGYLFFKKNENSVMQKI